MARLTDEQCHVFSESTLLHYWVYIRVPWEVVNEGYIMSWSTKRRYGHWATYRFMDLPTLIPPYCFRHIVSAILLALKYYAFSYALFESFLHNYSTSTEQNVMAEYCCRFITSISSLSQLGLSPSILPKQKPLTLRHLLSSVLTISCSAARLPYNSKYNAHMPKISTMRMHICPRYPP